MITWLREVVWTRLLSVRDAFTKTTSYDAYEIYPQDDVIRDIPRRYIEGLKRRDAEKKGK
jgi:hypothetical protein